MHQGELAHLVGGITNDGDWHTIRFSMDLWILDVLNLQHVKGNCSDG